MADYQLLSQDEQDDTIVSSLLAQERDHFCHTTNLQRFEEMLKTLPEGAWRTRITQLRDDTKARLAEVDSILKALKAQLPPAERLAAAKKRLTTK